MKKINLLMLFIATTTIASSQEVYNDSIPLLDQINGYYDIKLGSDISEYESRLTHKEDAPENFYIYSPTEKTPMTFLGVRFSSIVLQFNTETNKLESVSIAKIYTRKDSNIDEVAVDYGRFFMYSNKYLGQDEPLGFETSYKIWAGSKTKMLVSIFDKTDKGSNAAKYTCDAELLAKLIVIFSPIKPE